MNSILIISQAKHAGGHAERAEIRSLSAAGETFVIVGRFQGHAATRPFTHPYGES
jgi:N-formylglutamate amidohydrolase